jgi:glycosyltransferase involved in cell wall biosynthesis
VKVAYVTVYDARDVTQMSGAEYFVLRALRQAGVETRLIGPLTYRWPRYHEYKKRGYRRLLHQKYTKERVRSVARDWGRQAEQALHATDAEVVFSPSPMAVAYLQCSQPIVFYHDAAFAGLVDYYPYFTGLCRESRKAGHAIDQAALRRCRLAVYTSDWAAMTAREHYGIDEHKLRVVPRGANIEHPPSRQDVERAITARDASKCRLLWVGTNWKRKGGPFALEVAAELARRSVPVELIVVGMRPEIPDDFRPFTKVIGRVSKADPLQARTLDEAYADSHFLILPTRAECFGQAVAEASAFGVPALASRTGGVPSAVSDGVNGRLFDLSSSPAEYCDVILELLSTPGYDRLAISARGEYESRLNWSSSGAALVSILREALGKP